METDAVRPTELSIRHHLNKQDSYGDEKLGGEELLAEQRQTDGGKGCFPYMSLRFADVIGPRDGTNRWVKYQLCVTYVNVKGIPALHVPNDVVETTSIT